MIYDEQTIRAILQEHGRRIHALEQPGLNLPTHVGSVGNLGKTLAIIRKVAGLSQGEVADRIGLGPANLSALETGQRIPKFSTVERVAGALGYKLSISLVPLEEGDTITEVDSDDDES